jgi:type VI secretion system protein ImpF
MSKPSSVRPVMQSLLDRLTDVQPDQREDARITHAQSVRQLKIGLQRDLEWMLNTRRIAIELPESAEALRNSLYSYGLPEFAGLNTTLPQDQLDLLKEVEQSVAIFEPRLTAVRVALRASEGSERAVHFVIEAILRIDPVPEHVAFDTVLELTSGAYRVRGES